MKRGIMKKKTFDIILDKIGNYLDSIKVVVLYHGGEPLLNKYFFHMVEELKKLNVPTVKTVTNGMIMDDAIITNLVNSRLDIIEFSIDGQSRETNDFIRRNSNYYTVCNNLKNLIIKKKELFSNHPQIIISNTQFINSKMDINAGLTPPIPEFLKKEFSQYLEEEITINTQWAMVWPHMNVLKEIFDIYKDTQNNSVNNYCDNVDSTITIRWNGDVVACCYDLTSKYILGNINDANLWDIFNNDKYLNLRRSIYDKKFIEMCDNCNVVKPNYFLSLKPGFNK